MICFVILHYMVETETHACVASIREKVKGNKKIIVIDNNSSNGSGLRLKEKYAPDEDVDVLLNTNNLGFAKGNNVGYQWAKAQYNPDFIVMMNNDVEIVSNNFATELRNLYDKEQFHLLGPDIYSTTYDLHQNPKRLMPYTYEEVKKLNVLASNNLEKNWKMVLKCWLKSSSFLRETVYKKRITKQQIDYTQPADSVILHGSCVIYSKQFIQLEQNAFYPETFFYYEMEILDYLCRQKGYKVIYRPEIKVLHHQNAATNVVHQKMVEKTLFSYRCTHQSTSVFLALMEQTK